MALPKLLTRKKCSCCGRYFTVKKQRYEEYWMCGGCKAKANLKV